jgi:hypothetical protein
MITTTRHHPHAYCYSCPAGQWVDIQIASPEARHVLAGLPSDDQDVIRFAGADTGAGGGFDTACALIDAAGLRLMVL